MSIYELYESEDGGGVAMDQNRFLTVIRMKIAYLAMDNSIARFKLGEKSSGDTKMILVERVDNSDIRGVVVNISRDLCNVVAYSRSGQSKNIDLKPIENKCAVGGYRYKLCPDAMDALVAFMKRALAV